MKDNPRQADRDATQKGRVAQRKSKRTSAAQTALKHLGLAACWPNLDQYARVIEQTPEFLLTQSIVAGMEALKEKAERIQNTPANVTVSEAYLYEAMLDPILELPSRQAEQELDRVSQLMDGHPGFAEDRQHILNLIAASTKLNEVANPARTNDPLLADKLSRDEHYQDNAFYLWPLLEQARKVEMFHAEQKEGRLDHWASNLEDVATLLQHHAKWTAEVELMHTIAASINAITHSKVLAFARREGRLSEDLQKIRGTKFPP